ncbi:DUF4351 domain-containing protein [Umezakia ovalisporum]|jgi:predicted transposase YdaD|uniref:DUF4351 domain-containing protein n=1 Tax=Umezakia ovalisporum TaxID=75695 RepID=UPI0026D71A28|nr:DUF4351 domain-containing protein [Umezakia ovalisporum]
MLGLDLVEPGGIREAKEEGLEQGLGGGSLKEALSLVMGLLNRPLGEVSPQCVSQIQGLSLSQIETLGEDLLDFTTVADLQIWLQCHV